MKIKFLKDREVEAQGEVVESYKAGQIVELSTPSARRWIRRHFAVEVQGEAPPAPRKSRARKAAPKSSVAKEPSVSTEDSPR